MKSKSLLVLLCAISTVFCCQMVAQPYFYTNNIQTFISNYGCTNCHGATSPSSGFNQTTYVGLLTGGSQCAPDIRPFDETGSPFVIKIDCSLPLTCGSNNMPLGSPCMVSASDIAIVRAWIRSGALGDNTYCQSFTGTPLSINFTGFGGGGFTASPSASQLSSKVWNFGGFSDFYKPGQSNTGNDFGRGPATPGAVSTGGVYGCTYATGNQAMWIQAASNDFSSPNGGSINLQVCNNSGSALTSVNISYDILVYNDQARANSFNFLYSADGSTYTQVVALDYTSPAAPDASPSVITVPRSTTLTGLNIPNGAMFFLRWFGNDVSGVGNRDEFGLDNITVSLPVTCSITNVAATTATCSGTSAVFNVSFTAAGGSGVYNVINTANNSVLASGSTSPIAVSIPNSTSATNISINVTDAANALCAGIPVSVALPDCTPVCSISGVSATTPTCSGTSAIFNVLFTAANGSGVYNVINTANSTVLASGSTSPIAVSIPNNTSAVNISINVIDASNALCAGTPVSVALPDCTPPVFCGNGTCDGTENYCTCPADCACVIAAAFVNFNANGDPISSALPVAFCQQDITGEVNPGQPHYLFVPLRVEGVSCATYNITSDEGSFYVVSGNTLQSTASIGNLAVVWLRMSQAEINIAGSSTTINFSGSGGNCLAAKTIMWNNVTNFTGNVATTCKSALVLRLFLTGAYDFAANNGAMRTNINGLLPIASPYTALPWNAPAATATQIPANMVDWVLIELRNPVNNALVESQAGLLASDGFVYNTELQPALTFNASGNFLVVARHRNHVAIMSANTVNPDGGVMNLTIPANVAGGSSQLVNLGGTGLYGLIPGDLNANGVNTYADFNVYYVAGTLSNVYAAADCNMDGMVDVADFGFMRLFIQQSGITPIRY